MSKTARKSKTIWRYLAALAVRAFAGYLPIPEPTTLGLPGLGAASLLGGGVGPRVEDDALHRDIAERMEPLGPIVEAAGRVKSNGAHYDGHGEDITTGLANCTMAGGAATRGTCARLDIPLPTVGAL